MIYHTPVMVSECIQGLNIDPQGIYVDVTFGGGGHSKAILSQITKGMLFAFDQDPDTKANLIDDRRFMLINENFRYMKNFLKLHGGVPVNGILADLGVSSWQIDEPGRGFSTRLDGELDMRMDKKGALTAKHIINNYEAERLGQIFIQYGELKNGIRIAREIELSRRSNPISTTSDLKAILKKFVMHGRESKFYAQVFQALRIEVNNELIVLSEFLMQCLDVLKTGGRLVIISYHSLEDRMVKNFIKSGNLQGEIKKDFFGNNLSPVKQVGKMATPSEAELQSNPRARSARLRVCEKIK